MREYISTNYMEGRYGRYTSWKLLKVFLATENYPVKNKQLHFGKVQFDQFHEFCNYCTYIRIYARVILLVDMIAERIRWILWRFYKPARDRTTLFEIDVLSRLETGERRCVRNIYTREPSPWLQLMHAVQHVYSITRSSSNVESLITILISRPTNGKYKSEVVSRLSPFGKIHDGAEERDHCGDKEEGRERKGEREEKRFQRNYERKTDEKMQRKIAFIRFSFVKRAYSELWLHLY